jgi:hypothetical protein
VTAPLWPNRALGGSRRRCFPRSCVIGGNTRLSFWCVHRSPPAAAGAKST